MLVVRRRAGEAIVLATNSLGDEIEVQVVEISRTRVKLGVRASRAVTVRRREAVHVAHENQSAAGLLGGGPRVVGELLRMLENICANSSQAPPGDVDK
ncbi:MAG: carbon storage regulator [Acidobacteriota bacterium]